MRMLFALSLVAAAYAGVVAVVYAGQRSMLYPAPSAYRTPAAVGLSAVQEVPLTADDGTAVMLWWRPAADGAHTVLHFHGNGESLPAVAPMFDVLAARGLGLAVMTYRGYPGSGGAPSEAALMGDAALAYRTVTGPLGVAPDRLIVSGNSLGSTCAVAVAAGATIPPAALFLTGAMSSIEDVAAAHFPWLPVRALIKDRLRSADLAPHVRAPVLMLHGSDDRVVPLRFARRLYAAFQTQKQLIVLPGHGHVFAFGAGWDAVAALVAAETRPATSAKPGAMPSGAAGPPALRP